MTIIFYIALIIILFGVANYEKMSYKTAYLRKEKAQLTQELIEHGCRRKN